MGASVIQWGKAEIVGQVVIRLVTA